MSAPWWLSGGLAATMLVIAAYCAVRPAAARRWHRSTERDVDAAHVLMGVVMAATLVPRLNPIRGDAWAAGCVIAFAVAAAWFAIRSLRDWRRWSPAGPTGRRGGERAPGGSSHHLVHLLSCGSMIYMLLAAAAGSAGMGASAAGGAAAPLIALVLAVAMAGSVVVTTDRLAALAPVRRGQAARGQPIRSQLAGQPAAAQPAGGQPGGGQPGGASYGWPALCPRVAASCQIAMGITMLFMLVQLF